MNTNVDIFFSAGHLPWQPPDMEGSKKMLRYPICVQLSNPAMLLLVLLLTHPNYFRHVWTLPNVSLHVWISMSLFKTLNRFSPTLSRVHVWKRVKSEDFAGLFHPWLWNSWCVCWLDNMRQISIIPFPSVQGIFIHRQIHNFSQHCSESDYSFHPWLVNVTHSSGRICVTFPQTSTLVLRLSRPFVILASEKESVKQAVQRLCLESCLAEKDL